MEYSLILTPGPTSFLTAKDDLLGDSGIITTHLRRDPLISSAIDVEEAIDQRLRAKLNPSIVAINHEHQIVIARFVKAIQVLGCAVDFCQMRAAFDESRVIECLVPVDDGRFWVAEDIARYDRLAEIWIWS